MCSVFGEVLSDETGSWWHIVHVGSPMGTQIEETWRPGTEPSVLHCEESDKMIHGQAQVAQPGHVARV